MSVIGTFAFCLLGAVVPVFNAEAYLLVAAGTMHTPPVLLALAAATGQVLGDVVSIGEVGPGQASRSPLLQGAAYKSADLSRAALPLKAGKDDLRVRLEVVWAFQ